MSAIDFGTLRKNIYACFVCLSGIAWMRFKRISHEVLSVDFCEEIY